MNVNVDVDVNVNVDVDTGSYVWAPYNITYHAANVT